MRYDAFISYRHSELDMYIAKKVHKGLETFKVPRAVQKKSGKKNIKRVFRDQEELPIGSDLGDNIEGALAQSEFLIVICSPRTPESYWVQKEISTFIQMHDREHVLAILIEGEPDQSFPRQLLVDEHGNPVEPLAADVRGTSKSEIDKKLKTELMRLAAPLLHCSYDDLRQRHRERRMKKIVTATTVAAGLAVAFGAYSAYNSAMIQQNYEEKQRNQSRYLADTSISLLESCDRKTAVLVALEALPTKENDRPYVASAQYALSEALCCYDTGSVLGMDISLKHDLPVSELKYNTDGSVLVSIDQGDSVYVWNVADGELLAKIAPEVVNGRVVAPVEAATEDGHLWICDGSSLRSLQYDGTEEWRTAVDCYYCEVNAKLGIAACVASKEVIFIDIWSGEVVGRIEEQSGNSFTSKMSFDVNKNMFVVAHLASDTEAVNGTVTVYDFNTRTATDYVTQCPYILDIKFTTDGNLAVADSKDLLVANMNEDGTLDGCMEKIDLFTQSQCWMHEFTLQMFGNESGYVLVHCRAYTEEETGTAHDEVMVSVDNRVYTWDSATGESVMNLTVPSGIVSFQVSSTNSYGFVTEGNGTVNIINTTTGQNYTSSAIDIGRNVLEVIIQKGTLASRAYSSPNITLMKYHEGAGIEELGSYDNSILSVKFSTNEQYYAIESYESNMDGLHYNFFRTEDDALIGEYSSQTEPDRNTQIAADYIDENCFVYITSDGIITYFNMETGEKEDFTMIKDTTGVDGGISQNRTMAFLYDYNEVYIADLAERKVVFHGEVGDYIHGGIVSSDGKWAFCSTEESDEQLYMIDLTSGKLIKIENADYNNIFLYKTSTALAANADGTLLAASCVDNYIRILDTQSMQTIAEVPFASAFSRFMQFSEDGSKLMLQGDDKYFRVYDLETKEFIYVSPEQYNTIESLYENESMKNISLFTESDVTILNMEDYEMVTYVEGGLAYLPETSVVYTSYYYNLYRFPYMTLDMLLKEAEYQFGDAQLTAQERAQYHVD